MEKEFIIRYEKATWYRDVHQRQTKYSRFFSVYAHSYSGALRSFYKKFQGLSVTGIYEECERE